MRINIRIFLIFLGNMNGKNIKPDSKYKQFTIRFLNRSIRFLTVSVFVLLFFYFFSNFQDFLDASLFVILNVLISFCVLLAIFTFCSILLKVFFMIRYKEKAHILKFIADAFLFFMSIILALIFSFLVVLAAGNA